MVGDLFHWGHVELFKAARAFGDFLIVGVLSDSVASSYKRLPIMTMAERVSVIQACRFVDAVIPDAPDVVTSEFMHAHGISLVVHGSDLSAETREKIYADPVREGKLRVVDYTKGISTSDIIRRIRASGR
jgi:cytidyltransferase-like protein